MNQLTAPFCNALRIAREGVEQAWSMKREYMSPSFTINWQAIFKRYKKMDDILEFLFWLPLFKRIEFQSSGSWVSAFSISLIRLTHRLPREVSSTNFAKSIKVLSFIAPTGIFI